jgi:hypothetical protein
MAGTERGARTFDGSSEGSQGDTFEKRKRRRGEERMDEVDDPPRFGGESIARGRGRRRVSLCERELFHANLEIFLASSLGFLEEQQ